ncbi:hypothetical protein [Marinirhabdus gelatinilytica]|uniref:Chemoreceptor-like protein with four helix bundle sensory module n=1 Tax=Marinirhabdus gelatinilytica TaxID=1703343 RepID=A0A370QLD9_9FLAO|nr:hypothetical protein [Marinirhabdus gelatinilytica]RDK89178.1 hypothetical protein C8D94_1011059 [Marinirhabdus gelatinilytica]
MSKKRIIANRINIVLVFIAIVLLILGANRIDNSQFKTAHKDVVSVFNDRVLAQNYIYKLNNLIHEKEQLFLKRGTQAASENINKEIETLIILFSETELTNNETQSFENFKNNYTDLKSKETEYFKNSYNQPIDENIINIALEEDINIIQTDLDNLALIQVSEIRTTVLDAQKSLSENELKSSIETYFLLGIGIIVLVIIFYRINKYE